MSDLHRAVEDEIDAFRPDRIPPFAAVLDRQRSQHRRRKMLAVATPALIAVLVAPVAWSALTGGGDQLVQQAGPAEEAGSSRAAFLPSQGEGRSRLALASGLLGGDPSTGCLWLSAADSADSITSPILILHNTAVADFTRTPWVIRDGDTVLATEGEQVELVGGHGPDGADMSVPGCPVDGQPFSGLLNRESATGQPTAEPTRQEPDPFAPSKTRYSITYDSEAVYNQHDAAVQACLDLPGTSDIFALESLPPIDHATVTGFRENTAFQECFSGLAGVTVTALIPYDPTTAPDEFINRSSLPSCGQHVVGHGATPRSAIDCFANALGSPAGAEYAVSRLSEEGDPTVIYYRALPGQQSVEVFLDTTRDNFGKKQWLQATCTGFDPTFGKATGCPPNGTGQI